VKGPNEPNPSTRPNDDHVLADDALLERLQAELTWPTWQQHGDPIIQGKTQNSDGSPSAPADLDVTDVVERSIETARLAEEGGAYVSIAVEGARAASQRGARPDGPLKAYTFAVKDLIAVAGLPLRAGSRVRAGVAPERSDAPIVRALRQAGAIFIGTTALHEFAFGVTGVNRHTGTPANPHDASRIPGGSSSGSAVAVAEGSARIALGTDTGGSVRIPAALCGVVGFKFRHSAYPSAGVFPLSPTLDHLGLLARSVADVRTVQEALGRAAMEPIVPSRVGVSKVELESCECHVGERIESALRALSRRGCDVVEVAWPGPETAFAPSTAIMFSEAAAVHRSAFAHNAEQYGADVRRRLATGLNVPATAYVGAIQQRRRLSARVQSILSEVDCVLGPTVGVAAPKLSEAADPALPARLVANTRLANLAGVPALSLPLPGDGLPVGLQLIGGDEATLLGFAGGIEGLLEGAMGRPSFHADAPLTVANAQGEAQA
jgi:Asp-tRNA(Asn)/Glu-tRNA(Gln) amidotransferase A subunit family amidase